MVMARGLSKSIVVIEIDCTLRSVLFGISYEQSSRHDLYVPRFEAELSQFCEKLVS